MMDIATFAKRLGGDVAGRDRVLLPGPGHSPKDRSLAVVFTGTSYVVHSFSGDDWKSCRDHVAAALGLESSTRFVPPSIKQLEDMRRAEQERIEWKQSRALECWREAKPVGGTLAEAYLRARGITYNIPDTLRFHPACWHPSKSRIPAMVAIVEGGASFAVHRTYLRIDGSGKSINQPNKAMLGSVSGGAVRLSPIGDKLVVCEGIETGLALLSGLIPYPATVWAALSTSGMKRLVLPQITGKLVVATDGDVAGRDAGKELAIIAAKAGWTVSTLPAPDGKDWNDVLNMRGELA